MKKCLVVVLLASIISVVCTGCNKKVFDFQYTFNKAVINIGGEFRTIDVAKWTDYEGEQIQIITPDGTVYLTSSFNCTLIKE